MTTWEQYPPARPGLTGFDPGGAKGILHTTEGDYPAGAKARMQARDMAAFQNLYAGSVKAWSTNPNSFTPHFGICPPIRRVAQFYPMNVGSPVLEDLADGVRTNRAGSAVVQVELIGHADSLMIEYSDDDWRWLGQQLRAISVLAGIPYTFHPEFKSYPASAGKNNGVRMNDGFTYSAFSGWCGHQHVPENVHGDPGLINLALLNQTHTPQEGDMTILASIPGRRAIFVVDAFNARRVSNEANFHAGAAAGLWPDVELTGEGVAAALADGRIKSISEPLLVEILGRGLSDVEQL